MDIFIKDFATYHTIKHLIALEYSLVVDSLSAEQSSVVVGGAEIDIEDVGNWLIADGNVYQIAEVSPSDNSTELTLRDPLDVFVRLLEFSNQPTNQTIGGFIASQLQNNWVSIDDPLYAVPYLIVSNLDTTAFVPPEIDGSSCFALPDYCRLMRKTYRVAVQFSNAGDNLVCTIQRSSDTLQNISFEDGTSSLISADAATTGYAKLTVLHDIDSGEKDANGDTVYNREKTTWYLSEDGNVSQLVPSRRSIGEWGVLQLKDEPNVEEKVIEAFSENRSGSKLEFTSVKDIAVNTSCAFVIRGKLHKSYISCKRQENRNDRYFYKAGELATTITEKLKGVIK